MYGDAPVQDSQEDDRATPTDSDTDTSCYSAKNNKATVPPPVVPNAHNRLERDDVDRKSRLYVTYTCLPGYTLRQPEHNSLYCTHGTWMGEVPECVRNTTVAQGRR